MKILDFLYNDSDESFRLNRKYEKYLQLKKSIIKRAGNYSSKYRGVSYHKREMRWGTSLDNKSIGYFQTETEAALAYNTKCLEKYNDINKLNKIVESSII